jgi:hypothetical protein
MMEPVELDPPDAGAARAPHLVPQPRPAPARRQIGQLDQRQRIRAGCREPRVVRIRHHGVRLPHRRRTIAPAMLEQQRRERLHVAALSSVEPP